MLSVSPYKTGLDQGNAYWMARIAKEAYRSVADGAPNESAILANLQQEDLCFHSVFGVSVNSSQAILVEHEEFLCVAFRGTDEWKDWLDNARLITTESMIGKFHRGFLYAFLDVWQPIFQRYLQLRAERVRPVFFTGHSLGGAMATIATAKFIDEDLPFTSTYTFGQPRVMTRETARVFNTEVKGRFHRFHNNNDLVTRVPARFMGYSHVGTYHYIMEESDGRSEIHSEPGFWSRFLDQVEGVVKDVKEVNLDGIKDHAISEYVDAIEQWNYQGS